MSNFSTDFSVTVGSQDLDSLIGELRNQGYFVHQPIQQLATRNQGIRPAASGGVAVTPESGGVVNIASDERVVALTAPTLNDLGISSHVRYQSVIDRADELGLSRASVEATLLARMVYDDQPEGEDIVGTHDAIDISSFGASREEPMTIYLAHESDTGQSLIAKTYVNTGIMYGPNRRFLFQK